MGRLQRKKTSGAKKKKKKSVASAEAQKVQKPADVGGTKVARATTHRKKARAAKPVTTKKQSSAVSTVTAKPKTNFIQAAIQFLREVKIELKKVTWPSRKQTIGSTAVVIALVIIISMFLGAVDIGLSNLIRVVLQ
ncbi:MAG: preprotein translocase subunit SecE [Desulfobacterales bacterium]|jgi:preprotein translocase subunit SecE